MNIACQSLSAKNSKKWVQQIGHPTSIFAEDVVDYVESLEVVSTPSFLVKGRSGLDFSFDIQVSGRKSELVIKPFSLLRQNAIERFLFCMEDIKDVRENATGKELKSLAIINDTTEPPKRLINALAYFIHRGILFS